jgi:type II secretory pathway component GspD/PulD (secretin)
MIGRIGSALLAVILLACNGADTSYFTHGATLTSAAPSNSARTFDFGPNQTMTSVIAMLAMQTGRPLVPGPDLSQMPVTLHLERITPAEALKAIEAAYGLAEVQSGPVTIIVPRSKVLDVQADTVTAELQTPPNSSASVVTLAKAVVPDVATAELGTSSVLATGSPAELQRLKDLINQIAAAYTTQTVTLSYTEPDKMVSHLKDLGLIDNGINATTNDLNKSVSFVGPAASLTSLVSTAKMLDKQPKRGVFKVTVLETQPLNDSSNIGIVWGQPVGTSTTTSTTSSSQLTITQGTAASATINLARMYLTQIPIGAQINALVSHGQGKVLAAPTILFNNDEPGTFAFAENYPIQTSTGGISPTSSVTYYPIGIILNIQGLIGEHGQITTKLQVQDGSIVSFDPKTGLPIIGNRSTTGTVTVYPGESIVFAGFLDDEESDTITKVPLLGDIPIIGELFKNRQHSHTRTELSFVIQPEIPPTPPTGYSN